VLSYNSDKSGDEENDEKDADKKKFESQLSGEIFISYKIRF
jgi:hypothetical protein